MFSSILWHALQWFIRRSAYSGVIAIETNNAESWNDMDEFIRELVDDDPKGKNRFRVVYKRWMND